MVDCVDTENQAGLARVTCGWKKPELSIDAVRLYWRDAHSPAIARRDGLYEYRHFQFDAVRPDLFKPVDGVSYNCDETSQLMWVSDVRYRDQAGLDAFGGSPDGEVRAQILADIDLIVDKSTTYLVVGENGRTLIDVTGDPAPQGPVRSPTYSIFVRKRGPEVDFRLLMNAMAKRWSETSGVQRVRVALFDAPDMEAERKAGYPVKTHPLEQQYQAWIDLVVDDDAVAARLIASSDGVDYSAFISEIHAYPTRVVYTSNYAGRLTLVGLRGYPAYEAINRLGGAHQTDRRLLQWMYGPVATFEAA